MARRSELGRETRRRVALEAARIMVDEGLHDFQSAKRKAANRLNVNDRIEMPSNAEIDHEVKQYLALFKAGSQSAQIKEMRQEALKAMNFLERFQPRLVGSVLEGTAAENSRITLHVFALTSEELNFFFMDHNIPFEVADVNIRTSGRDTKQFPVIRFYAGDMPMEVVVFPKTEQRQVPLSQVDGKTMRRADASEVRGLIEREAGNDSFNEGYMSSFG